MEYGFLFLGTKAIRRRRDRKKRRAEKNLDKYAKCIKKHGRNSAKCAKYKLRAKSLLKKANVKSDKLKAKGKTSLLIEDKKEVPRAIAKSLVAQKVSAEVIQQETGLDVTDPTSGVFVDNYAAIVEQAEADAKAAEEAMILSRSGVDVHGGNTASASTKYYIGFAVGALLLAGGVSFRILRSKA